MAKIELHPDFKDFLRLLNSHRVKYLLVGGYAVSYHGYPRATGDMDIWIAVDENNSRQITAAVRAFGMPERETNPALFLTTNKIVRMGNPPVRIEVLTGASGVNFAECYARRTELLIDDIIVPVISLDDLKINKMASGRHKDLEDLEQLP